MHKPENDLPWSFREINTIENMSFNQRLLKKKKNRKKESKVQRPTLSFDMSVYVYIFKKQHNMNKKTFYKFPATVTKTT